MFSKNRGQGGSGKSQREPLLVGQETHQHMLSVKSASGAIHDATRPSSLPRWSWGASVWPTRRFKRLWGITTTNLLRNGLNQDSCRHRNKVAGGDNGNR